MEFDAIAKWANEQGLTTKPSRRKRSHEEILSNVPIESNPKISIPVNHKTIENILSNPFYIRKNKVKGGGYIDATSHQPLIDMALYNKVQDVLRSRRVSVRYVDNKFSVYRAIVRCSCGRAYCAYTQKDIVYYRTRCNPECDNPDRNLKEEDIHKEIQTILDRIHFSDDELKEIEAKSHTDLDRITDIRNKELDDLHVQRKRVFADLDYITKNRITLLRTNSMSIESLKDDESKLTAQMAEIDQKLNIYTEAAQEMLQYVITFSELVKNASLYYRYALDSEKREIATLVFTELTFKNKKLEKYTLNEGFEALFRRSVVFGARGGNRLRFSPHQFGSS